MKYIKQFEGIWSKKIKIGTIYRIDSMIISEKEYKHNIPLGRVIKSYQDNLLLDVKTFIKGSYDEFVMSCLSPSN